MNAAPHNPPPDPQPTNAHPAPSPAASTKPSKPPTPAHETPTPSSIEHTARQPLPRRVTVPPESFDPLKTYTNLLLAVAVAIPALFLGLNRADVHEPREAETLLRSRETWVDIHNGNTAAWLIPTRGSIESVDRGPLTVWLHILAWTNLDPDSATPDQLAHRARIASAITAVVTLIATYWAAVSIGGVRTGRMTTLALGTTLLFVYYARYATTDTLAAASITLAAAAGLWAARPLKLTAGMGRRVLGWPIAGIALAAAILTIGAPAVPLILTPIIAAISLTPKRRIDNLFGLLFALLLGVMISMPWFLYVLGRVDGAWQQMTESSLLWGTKQQTPWRIWQWPLLISPWQVWLIGGLLQPFLRAASEARRQLLIAWFWFAAPAAAMIGAGDDRFVITLLPAAALIVGQLWSYHAQLATERTQDPGVDLLRIPHWALIIAMSIAGPTFIALQPWLVTTDRLERIELPGINWIAALGLAVALLLIALLGSRWHWKWRPRLAAYATAAWMATALTIALTSYANSSHERYPQRQSAQQTARLAAGRPLLYLTANPGDPGPEPAFLFYLNQNVRAAHPDRLTQLLNNQRNALVIASLDLDTESLRLTPLSAEPFHIDSNRTRRLYIPTPETTEQP